MAIVDVELTTRGQEASSAGQDPAKRAQIMQGARQVFLEKGFDGASMNDIARAAGVSKGTLYVYFEDKERLFVELISTEKREEVFRVVRLDSDDHDVPNVLRAFGTRLCNILTRPYYVQAMRTVFGIINRMPEIGVEFYSTGPQLCTDHLQVYLEAQVKAGVLVIDDCTLAAQQFVELSQSGLLRRVLFGVAETPTDAEITHRVESAIAIFMKAYAPPKS
ncbi:TetR/AcrR family transcriptional regulator [Kaistia dalseonensis]|uniref:AcrR family transcriptional regulator n=1 Tax=Kaistia dalseonensis TaxID=410840 RepID=A0ABU0H8E7_9HYPH|nr:TetR/AcrR family transcriptional regulator [Kaistia dalseonensis]MCX5495451.1 TetR/AcrR family transcriptional regulator [Kaistia dalseonensis]MDQ0438040.1 AcrR family transcriptional regulator [Kaistia dalseonensis]